MLSVSVCGCLCPSMAACLSVADPNNFQITAHSPGAYCPWGWGLSVSLDCTDCMVLDPWWEEWDYCQQEYYHQITNKINYGMVVGRAHWTKHPYHRCDPMCGFIDWQNTCVTSRHPETWHNAQGQTESGLNQVGVRGAPGVKQPNPSINAH